MTVYRNSITFSRRIGRCIRNYEIVSILGKGGNGIVYKVKNTESMIEYALKMSIRDFSVENSVIMQEVDVLSKIGSLDSKNDAPILKVIESFTHDSKLCMVFPLMGESIARVLDNPQFKHFKREQIQHIGYQIFQGLNFLHRHGITHTDFKADNVMFTTSSMYRKIRIIDVGNARFDHQDHNIEISGRESQAPEILLDYGYNTCSDIWAAGVVLFEMWCGEVLFHNESRAVRLAIMEHVLGPAPVAYVSGNQYYPNGLLETGSSDQEKEYIRYKYKPLDKYVAREDGDPDEQFINLMRCLWEWEHHKRLPASQLLFHPFFDGMSDVYGEGYE